MHKKEQKTKDKKQSFIGQKSDRRHAIGSEGQAQRQEGHHSGVLLR